MYKNIYLLKKDNMANTINILIKVLYFQRTCLYEKYKRHKLQNNNNDNYNYTNNINSTILFI